MESRPRIAGGRPKQRYITLQTYDTCSSSEGDYVLRIPRLGMTHINKTVLRSQDFRKI